MAQSLENRINSALRSAARLADVEAVIGDVQTEIAATQVKLDTEVARSVDPALTTPEARQARNNAADLEHDIRRLNASLGMLNEVRSALIEDDAEKKRQAIYGAAKERRDNLARKIRSRYPAIAKELTDMINEIAASDEECRIANEARPRGASTLESAELLSRGCGYTWPDNRGLGEVTRLSRIQMPLLMRSGNYLPLQTSTITQNPAAQKAGIEIDQREAKEPIAGIDPEPDAAPQSQAA